MTENKERKRGRRHLFAPHAADWIRLTEDSSRNKASMWERFLAPAEDRSFWDKLDPECKDHVIQRADALLPLPFPQILLSDYREFSVTGIREHFEEKYFTRRTMLTKLVLAECVRFDGSYVDKILDGLYLILEETTWCLPAHNAYIRDAPQLPIPDAGKPVIDLFAAETAAILSLTEYVLQDTLDRLSPFIGQYIARRIRERILLPYLSFHFWWMGDGTQPMLNWTPWITQNVLLAVFFQSEGFLSPVETEKVLRQACVSLDYFLDEYEEDGCCDEGAQYFEHAGLCLFGCMEVIRNLTGDPLEDLFLHPLIRNMASYILKIYAGNGYYFNFADCSARPGHRNARDYLWGIRTENKSLASFAARDYQSLSWEERLLPKEENLFYHLLQARFHQEMMCHPAHEILPEDSWFESTQILTARDGRYSLAARGGSNGDSHNHNDTGSLILYKDGKPFLIDLGVETYTKKTFSEKRYEIWTMQSACHNLPTFFDGDVPIMQKAGACYGASSVQHQISENCCRLSMELASAYADERIRSYRRSVTLLKGQGVTIEDTCDSDLPCILSLMVYEKPSIAKEKEKWRISVENTGKILAWGCRKVTVETLPIRDPRLGQVWKHDCYRVLVSFEKEVRICLS